MSTSPRIEPQTDTTANCVFITNGRIDVGVFPNIGGTVGVLRLKNKPNVLKINPEAWRIADRITRFSASTPWKAFNGHTVWLGPQSEWWAHQDVSRELRDARAIWPPDPYHGYGWFEVVERRSDFLRMQGPPSEFTGVQLTKTLSFKDESVVFEVCARNIRKTPVRWDLWLNTRLDGWARCYVPLESLDSVRFDTADSVDIEYGLSNGFLTLYPSLPPAGRPQRWCKAFIYPDRPLIAGFTSGQALLIRFEHHSREMIHEKQALVEIYNCITGNPDDELLELEYHAPYRTLEPDETMSAVEQWELCEYDGTNDTTGHIDFLSNKVYLPNLR